MTMDTFAAAGLSDRELVLGFESLGDSCELGLVQRMVGVEPLGLFRFAGAPLRHLIRALEARFEGLADPAEVRVQPENGEYMIKLTKYDFIYHAHVKIGDVDPVALHRQQIRTLGFLIDKLTTDLTDAEKIMVFRQNEELSANDLMDFRSALAAYGQSRLLWIQETRAGHPPGTVVVIDDTLMVGYVTRLATRANAPDLDLRSWLGMLRQAKVVDRTNAAERANPASQARLTDCVIPAAARSVAKLLPRTDIFFGRDGNAAALTGSGWSAPESGFTWAVGRRSSLTIVSPGEADRYWLQMDVVPFVAPPRLMAQSMAVTVNGELIHRFDPLPRGKAGCVVPRRLLEGRDLIEIVLDHPDAASPRVVAGRDDDRRLAVSFYGLSVIGG